jgi:hypothetical protein
MRSEFCQHCRARVTNPEYGYCRKACKQAHENPKPKKEYAGRLHFGPALDSFNEPI